MFLPCTCPYATASGSICLFYRSPFFNYNFHITWSFWFRRCSCHATEFKDEFLKKRIYIKHIVLEFLIIYYANCSNIQAYFWKHLFTLFFFNCNDWWWAFNLLENLVCISKIFIICISLYLHGSDVDNRKKVPKKKTFCQGELKN
jgi:hypothetical protein